MNKKFLISIVGPTAIGKTNLAIDIAEFYKTEIISCDSRQFYKEMNIGTAVPSSEELNRIKHHFIQNISVHDSYSVGDFERDGLQFLEDFFNVNDICVMVGGSGLYEKAITIGLNEFPNIHPSVREELKNELEQFGISKLQDELKQVDPKYFAEVDICNKQRIIRALEVYRSSGFPFSNFRNKNINKRSFDVIRIGLGLTRENIYKKINHRVDTMINNGLLDEAKSLYHLKHLNALQTVGYKELFAFFDERIALKNCIEEIKKNTRNFAKRQMTWFKKDESTAWFSPYERELVIKYINSKL